ncbi:hypothetical protein [Algoriphagus antarcticus]|uniref:Uncharacterized protein n=1 Tax=Algoriphagus antarcticus TaxID=238540 RepID=A0A3E0DUT7_9BACT|nr:hypothetical protein [Algoriphagus antarcticus]REG87146.1 hypothetical protein C8N25_111125 [Algoriphagus antarcticus]
MKKNEATTPPTKKKKIHFVYRSFFNFWLAVILPASLITTIVIQLFKSDPLWLYFFELPSTYVKILLFQLIFGTWLYFKEYKPKSKKFREEA